MFSPRVGEKDDVIIGMAKFQRSLRAMDSSMLKKTLAKASRAGAKPVLKAMRTETRPISKTIARAFTVKVKVYKNSKVAIALVGVKNDASVRRPYSSARNKFRGKNESRGIHDPRFTFHLVDLGTKPHIARVFGKAYFLHPGTAPANIREKALRTAKPGSDAAYAAVFKKAVDEAIG